VHEVVRHRLAQVGAAVQQRYERAAPGEPDRCLRRRVAATDHADPGGAAALCLGRSGSVEHADALVVFEAGDRQPAIVSARGQHDGARRDLVVALQAHDVALCSGFERERAVRGRGACVELARLRDRAE
jgi:hypothetical protein